MYNKGLKIADFVKQFDLEVLNRGNDFDSMRLVIPDVNRPGLQFHDFYDYFEPRRLQVVGKAQRGDSKAQTTYIKRFPYTAVAPLSLWMVAPTMMKLTDNTLGFGKKLIWQSEE